MFHPHQILRWKNELSENSSKLFSRELGGSDKSERLIDELYRQIGQLKVDNEWLKKSCHDSCRRKKIND